MIKRVAIVGFGNIARKHMDVFRAQGAEVIASANRSGEKREEALKAGIPTVYADFHEMIRKEQPEGLLVSVSFWNMYQVLKELIPYKIPILAEKPTGTSIAEHIELEKLSQKHNTSVMIGLNRRHYSVLQKAIEHSGGYDEITQVLIEWSEDPYHLKVNRKLNDAQISKQLFGNSIHGLDLIVFLAGKPANVSFKVKHLGDPFRVHMTFQGESENKILFGFTSSWDNPVPWRMALYARNKRFVFAPLESCEFTEGKTKSTIQPDESDIHFKAGFYRQAKIFLDQSGEITKHNLVSVRPAMELAQTLFDGLFHEMPHHC